MAGPRREPTTLAMSELAKYKTWADKAGGSILGAETTSNIPELQDKKVVVYTRVLTAVFAGIIGERKPITFKALQDQLAKGLAAVASHASGFVGVSFVNESILLLDAFQRLSVGNFFSLPVIGENESATKALLKFKVARKQAFTEIAIASDSIQAFVKAVGDVQNFSLDEDPDDEAQAGRLKKNMTEVLCEFAVSVILASSSDSITDQAILRAAALDQGRRLAIVLAKNASAAKKKNAAKLSDVEAQLFGPKPRVAMEGIDK